MERSRSRLEPDVGVRILLRAASIEVRIVASMVVKEGVFVPTRSRETAAQRCVAASRATFLRIRWSSMPLRGLSRSEAVRVLPPTTLWKRLLIVVTPVLTRLVEGVVEEFEVVLDLAALLRIESISSSRSLRMKSPCLVLRPQEVWGTASSVGGSGLLSFSVTRASVLGAE